MNKKVLVTGASGQDGSYMIDFLLANTDHEVIGAIRRTSQLIDAHFKQHFDNPRFKIIHLDLSDPHSIINIIKNEKPDYFINFGAQTFVADSWRSPANHFQINALAVIHILEAIKNHQPSCRFYNAGSSEEFGDVAYSPQDENHPMRPRSPYGASKVAARCITKVYRESYGLYAIQGFLFNHESERRQDYFVTRKITKNVARIKRAIENKLPFEPLKLGNIESKRDWSYCPDFMDGVWKMLNQDSPKEYVLSSDETHSIKEFVELAFKAAGIEGIWVGEKLEELYLLPNYLADFAGITSIKLVEIDPQFYRPAEVEVLLGDSTRARQELGWTPKTSFQNLVDKMVLHDILSLNGEE